MAFPKGMLIFKPFCAYISFRVWIHVSFSYPHPIPSSIGTVSQIRLFQSLVKAQKATHWSRTSWPQKQLKTTTVSPPLWTVLQRIIDEWIPKMMVWTPFKYGSFSVSILNFWGVALFLQDQNMVNFNNIQQLWPGPPKKMQVLLEMSLSILSSWPTILLNDDSVRFAILFVLLNKFIG